MIAVFECEHGVSHDNVAVEVAAAVTVSQIDVLCPNCNTIMNRKEQS